MYVCEFGHIYTCGNVIHALNNSREKNSIDLCPSPFGLYFPRVHLSIVREN